MPSKEAGTIKFRLAKVPILKPHSNGECNKQCILFYVCPFVNRFEKKDEKGNRYSASIPGPGCPWFVAEKEGGESDD